MTFSHVVPVDLVALRLDVAVAKLEPSLSRAQARRLIEAGWITVEGAPAKPSHRLGLGERIEGRVPLPVPTHVIPEAIPLALVYDDPELVVVDKPAGLVVHPAPGHASGTLVNALLHRYPDLEGIGGVQRPGIVHRLDKGTSGLLVVAKNERAHRALAAQFRAHTIEREYLAIVRGSPRADSGSIDAAIGRARGDRKRFTTRVRAGRRSVTHWSVERRLGELTALCVRLETGRTHPIRVHLASVGLPVVGDPTYGGGRAVSRRIGLERPALHARVLGFQHPSTKQWLRFVSPLPADLQALMDRSCP